MPDASQKNIKPPSRMYLCLSRGSSQMLINLELSETHSQGQGRLLQAFQPEQDFDIVNDKPNLFNLPALNRLKIPATRTWNHGDLHAVLTCYRR